MKWKCDKNKNMKRNFLSCEMTCNYDFKGFLNGI